MNPFENNDEFTDEELSQMLGAWTVAVPSEDLRARLFAPRPVEVPSIWGAYAGHQNRTFAAALLVQACVVAFMLFTVGRPLIHKVKNESTAIILGFYQPKVPLAVRKNSGGGGGGQKALTPVAQGEAPRFAAKTFVPPAPALAQPKLPVEPTINAVAPQLEAANYGDPLSKLTGISPGEGVHGFGNGKDGGVGSGTGGGFGPGSGGGIGGGAYKIGGDVSAPSLIAKFEPEYSEEARKAKYSGSVLLTVVVDENGAPRDIHVVRPLGLGLDEKAIEAVHRWRFRPGMKNGKAVAVQAQVEVSFRLL